MTTTPRTEACPHCGAEIYSPPTFASAITYYACGTESCPESGDSRGQDCYAKSLCLEREKSQKLESEVERLREKLKQAIEIAHRYDEGWSDASDLFDTFLDNLDKFNPDKK